MAPLFRKGGGGNSGTPTNSSPAPAPLSGTPNLTSPTKITGSASTSSPSKSFSARLLRRRPSSARSAEPSDKETSPHPLSKANGSSSIGIADWAPGRRQFDSPRRLIDPNSVFLSSPVGLNNDDHSVHLDSDTSDASHGTPRRRPSRHAEHPFMSSANGTRRFDDNTDLTPAPIYPNSLSPPRRTLPKSPRAPKGTRGTPARLNLEQAAAVSDSSPTRKSFQSTRSSDSPKPSPIRPTVTAEWLSKRPTRGIRSESPTSLQGAAHIRTSSLSARSRTISTSSGDASTSGVDSEDGEVGIKSSRRRSQIDSARDGSGSYQVEVLCVDSRSDNEEMKWEVTIRRRRSVEAPTNGGTSSASSSSRPGLNPPLSPLQLSTSQSIAQAPSSASSINLSLALDQPTGKLVFIAFPMDLQATPRRKASTKHTRSQSRSSRPTSPAKPQLRAVTPSQQSQRPTTPPNVRDDTPPPAPNPNRTSPPATPPSYARRISENSMWPSPSRSGRRSPIFTSSPSSRGAEVWTPRRTRMVSAKDLDGGLYANGTVDGMSEELEK